MSNISIERLEEIRNVSMSLLTHQHADVRLHAEENIAIIDRLIAFESASKEALAWTDAEELRDAEKDGCGYLFKADPITPHADMRRVIKLYAAPQLQPEQKTCCHGALDNEDGVITCRSCGKEWNI